MSKKVSVKKEPGMSKRAIKAEAKQLAEKWVKEIREEKEAIREEARQVLAEWLGKDPYD